MVSFLFRSTLQRPQELREGIMEVAAGWELAATFSLAGLAVGYALLVRAARRGARLRSEMTRFLLAPRDPRGPGGVDG
jgi:hypothetical protein